MTQKLSSPRPTVEEVASLVHGHVHLVRRIAASVQRSIGRLLEYEELEAIGRTALFLAARDYNASAPFSAYASLRIRWAMIDAVRKETHGRANRESAIHRTVIDEAETEDESAGVRLSQRDRQVQDLAHDRSESPEDLLAELKQSLLLHSAVTQLDRRARLIVRRHYFEGEDLDEIARSINLSKSWLSRLHARAIQHLEQQLMLCKDGLPMGGVTASARAGLAKCGLRPPARDSQGRPIARPQHAQEEVSRIDPTPRTAKKRGLGS